MLIGPRAVEGRKRLNILNRPLAAQHLNLTKKVNLFLFEGVEGKFLILPAKNGVNPVD